MLAPPRNTVLLCNAEGAHANPKRGANAFLYVSTHRVLQPLQVVPKSSAPDRLPAAGFGSDGLKFDVLLKDSRRGTSRLYRIPRFSVRVLVILKSSWTNPA